MTLWWLAYPLLGIFAGFVAGLFGVGGGLTIVPLLFMLFTAQQFPLEHTMHLALGTSMATIVFTSISSMRAHHGHGAVRWDIVKSFAPGLVIGTLGGSFIATWVPTRPLAMVFTYAWFQILTSRLARTEDPMTMHFYTGWVGALIASAVLPLVWQAMPDATSFALLCLVGLMGTVGHFLLILAFARAPASTLTPYLYTQIGFAMLCGWLVFDHIPGALELAGIALIVVCGATASWLTAREKQPLLQPPEP